MTEFFIGIAGVLVGALITLAVDLLKYRLQTSKSRDLDNRRKALLERMLTHPPKETEWRSLASLSRVIGADYPTTTRLLIELGARGNEKENEVWALLREKPL
ncbi:hypothetical protein [Sneathiella sp.]|jgi:hypothetical protein|uniref:hypothetical protein n=1 Tax=Sneathiella sp. TaxID=1964365 RepID=UPI0039E453EF